MRKITLVYSPTVIPLMRSGLLDSGVRDLAAWVQERRPECGVDVQAHDGPAVALSKLLGHPVDVDSTESAAFGVEIAGRGCYHSWGVKAGRKDTAEYIAHTQAGPIPHASLLYHPHNTYFFAGLSRRVAKEMQRNYIGHAREEEGAPSQESSRYTEHPGWFVVPPRLTWAHDIRGFADVMQRAYDNYLAFLTAQGVACAKGLDRKRIYEAAMNLLPEAAATSFVWTTNPVAEMKLWRERCAPEADLEFQRFASLWRKVAVEAQPALYPGVKP